MSMNASFFLPTDINTQDTNVLPDNTDTPSTSALNSQIVNFLNANGLGSIVDGLTIGRVLLIAGIIVFVVVIL